jgi:Na+/melibiose symporter-like transporter
MAIGATLNMIIFKHVVGEPDMFAPAIFAQNIAAIIGIPLWVRLAGTIGKHRAIALAVLTIGAVSAMTFLVGRGEGLFLAALVVGIGSAMGGCFALVAAMIGDLVDRDLIQTGEERTGLMFAALGMATKLAVVFGVLIGTAIPGLAGFQPSDAVHDAGSLLVLRAVFAFVTPVLALIAAWLLWHYPLTRRQQQQLRARITELRRSSHRPGGSVDGQ